MWFIAPLFVLATREPQYSKIALSVFNKTGCMIVATAVHSVEGLI
jgi:hypothetical protein